MPHTLRTFLDSIDNRMLHLHDPVSPESQVGYLCSESRGPVMFHNLSGYPGWRLTDIPDQGPPGPGGGAGARGREPGLPLSRRTDGGRARRLGDGR